ncbi:MAG: hypothetical protein QNJ88_14045 [Acidimicrobiia bacterium]|nr:hypothetical protein [Acidimicrobiia bacterium]
MRRALAGVLVIGLIGGACSGDAGSTTTAGVTPAASTTAEATTGAPPTTPPPVTVETTTVAPTTEAPPTTTTTTTTEAPTTTEAVDRTPPEITITAPGPDETVTERSYRFAGFTEAGATLTAAGRYPVEVAADGSWSIVLILNPGGNVARFVAEDAAGNQTEINLEVWRFACANESSTAIAPGATNTSSITADIDRDGLPDTLTVYRAGTQWHVHAALGYDYETDVAITPPAPVTTEMRATSVVDIGFPALLLEVGQADAGRAYGFVAMSGCELVPVVDGSGQIPVIYTESRADNVDLFVCEPGLVTQVVVEHVEYGATIGVWEFRHRLDGLRFLPVKKTVRQEPTTPETADDDFAALVASYEACVP